MIRIQNLSYHYKKDRSLFRDLDFELAPGTICGLLGKNGAGKTTLLKLINGLLFPQVGDIDVLGFKPSDRLPAFRSECYLVPEDIYLPKMRIRTYVKLYAPFYPRFDHSQFARFISDFGLTDDRYLHRLSQGQKKKVILSFGLATNSRLLIMDEPTNGLDIPSKSQFRRLLSAAITDERSFIISTHQVRDVSNLIDPIIILDGGQVLFNESIESVTDKLHFSLHFREGDTDGALYTERTPGGYMAVSENQHGEYSELDLEVLFNAVISNQSSIRNIFQPKPLKHEA